MLHAVNNCREGYPSREPEMIPPFQTRLYSNSIGGFDMFTGFSSRQFRYFYSIGKYRFRI